MPPARAPPSCARVRPYRVGWPAGAFRPATFARSTRSSTRAPREPSEAGPSRSAGTCSRSTRSTHGPGSTVRQGFLQYQLAVPTGAERVLELVIERLRRGRVPCYLAVLKDFGPANGAPLSFPLAGWTLALDIPRAAPGLEPLLQGFDRAVADAGGRVYLSKDARLRPETVRTMYPRLDEWRAARDRVDPERVWCSDLARRVGLV